MAKKNRKKTAGAAVGAQQTVDAAFALILAGQVAELQRYQNAARNWDDIEGVHKMRVALRRMRSALRTFRPAIPRLLTQAWSDEMRWLAGQLGPARDLDVFIAEGLDAAAELPLAGRAKLLLIARQRREQAYQAVVAMLDSDRYANFKRDFAVWLENRAWLDETVLSDKQRQRLQTNIVPFARDRLDRQERRVLMRASGIDRNSAAEMHALRIECKRLRYSGEWFGPLFGGMDGYIAHLKALQDLLGVMNDIGVMQSLLQDLLVRRRDRGLLQYAGAVVGWRARQYEEIKDSFAERWQAFAADTRPWWRLP